MIKFKVSGEYSKIGEHLTTKKTPAVTMVAAWIKADTGVGPSIASGNQVWRNICADFPIAPINKRIQIRSTALTSKPKKDKFLSTICGIWLNTSE